MYIDTVSINLQKYVENNIFPQYKKNEKGHDIEHIEYVLSRCFIFAEQFPDLNHDILYAAAVYHDIGHHINKKNHEKISAGIFINDSFMKQFFSDQDRLLIAEAIEDHRASATSPPRSDYGKIISTADRSTDIDEFLKRTHSYTLKHFTCTDTDDIIDRAYSHAKEKYGNNGYAKHYLDDTEYENFLFKTRRLLSDKNEFIRYYRNLNKI